MRRILAAVAGLGLFGVAVVASAAPGPGATESTAAPSAPGSSLDLSVRARSLGLVPTPQDGTNLGIETMRAPTGAGRDRMPPARQEVAPGVFLYVDPNCLPGEEPFFPSRPGSLRRR
jgi:hypothetical protein